MPAALLSAYALIPQPPYGAHPFEDAWRRHLIVGIALLLWVTGLAARRRLPRPVPLMVPLLLLLLVQSASVVAAANWRVGVEPALDLLAGIAIFAALVDCPVLNATALRWILMVVALAIALACLGFIWGRWLDWHALTLAVPDARAPLFPPTVPRVLGVGTNPNIIAPLMTLAAPLYLLCILESRGWQRALVVAGAIAMQAGVFFTLSRSAWAGEAAGLVIAVGLLALAQARVRPWKKVTASMRRGMAIAALALLLVVGALIVTASLVWRPLWLFRPTFTARSDFRGAAFEMIKVHPLLGAGPGSFSLDYPYISNGDPGGAVHSHNIPLEIGVESGALGLIAAALVAGAAAMSLLRMWRRGGNVQRPAIACVTGALASFAIGGLGDAQHLFPEILFALGILLAIAIRTNREGCIVPARRASSFDGLSTTVAAICARYTFAIAPVVLGLALLVAWWRIDQADAHYATSIELATHQHWVAAASEAQRASSLDPAMSLYYAQAGVTLALEAEQIAPGDIGAQERAGTAAAAAPIRAQAINELRRALTLEPRSSVTRLDLAVLLELEGQHDQARAQVPSMLAGAPRDSLILLAAGVLDERALPERSVADYAAALAESPRIVDSPFWQATAFRRQRYGEIVQQALSRAGGEDSSSGPDAVRHIIAGGAGVAIIGGGTAGPFVARIDLARWYIHQGDSLAAGQILERALRERPDDPSGRLAQGELYAARGDLPAARREWLAGAYLGDVESIMHLGDTSPEGRVPVRILELGHWGLMDLWGRQFGIAVQDYRFAYRRHEPLPIVLPGEWLNALPLLYSRLQASVDRWEASRGPKANADRTGLPARAQQTKRLAH